MPRKTAAAPVPHRRPGRPASPLTEKYQLRMTAEDRARWEEAAAKLPIDLSDWIRIHAAKGLNATITIGVGGKVNIVYPKE